MRSGAGESFPRPQLGGNVDRATLARMTGETDARMKAALGALAEHFDLEFTGPAPMPNIVPSDVRQVRERESMADLIEAIALKAGAMKRPYRGVPESRMSKPWLLSEHMEEKTPEPEKESAPQDELRSSRN